MTGIGDHWLLRSGLFENEDVVAPGMRVYHLDKTEIGFHLQECFVD